MPVSILFLSVSSTLLNFVLLFWTTETLSMKGLTLNCMDRKSEAYELVRLGLKVSSNFPLPSHELLPYLNDYYHRAVIILILYLCRMTLRVMFAGMFMVFYTDQTENTGKQ